MNTSINLDEAREYLLTLVSQAEDILTKYFVSGLFTTRSKGGVDLLTQADEEVDQFLKTSIQKHFPDFPILTEETAPKDYSSLKNLDNLWVVDPLDGTINFSRHHPHFAISVGLVSKGLSRLGIVFVPLEKNLYWAQENLPQAYLNNKAISVSTTADFTQTILACDWGWDLKKRLNVVSWLEKIVGQVRQVKTMGSAVADLASLASGQLDGYFHSGLKPWDTAASSLLVEKAGGKITTPDGGKWDVFNSDMLATNGILHEGILKLIKEAKAK